MLINYPVYINFVNFPQRIRLSFQCQDKQNDLLHKLSTPRAYSYINLEHQRRIKVKSNSHPFSHLIQCFFENGRRFQTQQTIKYFQTKCKVKWAIVKDQSFCRISIRFTMKATVKKHILIATIYNILFKHRCYGKSKLAKDPTTSILPYFPKGTSLLRKKRQKLVNLVLYYGHSIGQASKRLKIKLSTAKMIVKRFRTDGTFFETRKQKLERLQNQTQRKERQNNLEIHNAYSQNSMDRNNSKIVENIIQIPQFSYQPPLENNFFEYSVPIQQINSTWYSFTVFNGLLCYPWAQTF